ncbi:hypothetical protein ILYODFUR_015850, partial [Ilyodon furcidens]
ERLKPSPVDPAVSLHSTPTQLPKNLLVGTPDSCSPACPPSNTAYPNTAELPKKHTVATKESHHSVPRSLPTSATMEKTYSSPTSLQPCHPGNPDPSSRSSLGSDSFQPVFSK